MLAYRGMVAQANLHTFDDSESRTSATALQTRHGWSWAEVVRQPYVGAEHLPNLIKNVSFWLQTSSGGCETALRQGKTCHSGSRRVQAVVRRPCGSGKRVILAPDEFRRL